MYPYLERVEEDLDQSANELGVEMRRCDPGYGTPSHGTQQLHHGLTDGVEHDQHREQVDDEASAEVDFKHSCGKKDQNKIFILVFRGLPYSVRSGHIV